jgi:hypothetical protein
MVDALVGTTGGQDGVLMVQTWVDRGLEVTPGMDHMLDSIHMVSDSECVSASVAASASVVDVS